MKNQGSITGSIPKLSFTTLAVKLALTVLGAVANGLRLLILDLYSWTSHVHRPSS